MSPSLSYYATFVNPSSYPKFFLRGDVRIFRHLSVN
jgi:hypothetical protein